MERQTPTDPPDEPVNRIAEFMEQIEARQQQQQRVEELNQLDPSIEQQSILRNDPVTKAMLEQALKSLKERYEMKPFDPNSLKPMAKALFKLGCFEEVIMLGEWLQTICPNPDAEIVALVAEARWRLG